KSRGVVGSRRKQKRAEPATTCQGMAPAATTSRGPDSRSHTRVLSGDRPPPPCPAGHSGKTSRTQTRGKKPGGSRATTGTNQVTIRPYIDHQQKTPRRQVRKEIPSNLEEPATEEMKPTVGRAGVNGEEGAIRLRGDAVFSISDMKSSRRTKEETQHQQISKWTAQTQANHPRKLLKLFITNDARHHTSARRQDDVFGL
ncbi:hypothetical protein KI387_012293, partial [Taxus chinensis]